MHVSAITQLLNIMHEKYKWSAHTLPRNIFLGENWATSSVLNARCDGKKVGTHEKICFY